MQLCNWGMSRSKVMGRVMGRSWVRGMSWVRGVMGMSWVRGRS